MKFTKEFLLEVLGGKSKATVLREDIGYEDTGYSERYLIFEVEGKIYQVYYESGYDFQPFEFETGDIECTEVEPYEVTFTCYRPKREDKS